MTHEMTLNADPFNRIKNGTKTIELRLFDSKRQALQIGDHICFKNTVSQDTLLVTVTGLMIFPTFLDLIAHLDTACLGVPDKNAALEEVHTIYPQEKIDTHNVIGIIIKRITI